MQSGCLWLIWNFWWTSFSLDSLFKVDLIIFHSWGYSIYNFILSNISLVYRDCLQQIILHFSLLDNISLTSIFTDSLSEINICHSLCQKSCRFYKPMRNIFSSLIWNLITALALFLRASETTDFLLWGEGGFPILRGCASHNAKIIQTSMALAI